MLKKYSLLLLPIVQGPRLTNFQWSGNTSNLSLHDILVYMGTISMAVTVVALLVAFNRVTRRFTQKLWQWAWKLIANPIASLMDRIPSRRMHDFVHFEDAELRVSTAPMPAPTWARERSSSRPGKPLVREKEFQEDLCEKLDMA